MRLTQALLRQHIGWHIKKHWNVQRKREALETPAFKTLREKNVHIYEAKDILEESRTVENVEIIGLAPKPINLDQTHPDWHDRVCLTYRDHNVLLQGLEQAKSLTKTVEIKDGLPEKIILKNTPKELNSRVKRIVMNSHLFDAQQEKLAKIKDPERPAFNFPRVLGITQERRNKLMTSRLLQLIESMSGAQLTQQRMVVDDLNFTVTLEKLGDLIQFKLRGDTVVTSANPLGAVTDVDGSDLELPNLDPIKDTITLNQENIYRIENMYPLNKSFTKFHPHTLFVHYDGSEVKNLYEEPVTDDQILARTLMKAFTAAASYAKQQHGENVKVLPKPVTLQCVHTDGRLYHFGVLQLNTLDLNSRDGPKNVFYQIPRVPMFASCSYVNGKPELTDYNSEVIKHLIAFYDNV